MKTAKIIILSHQIDNDILSIISDSVGRLGFNYNIEIISRLTISYGDSINNKILQALNDSDIIIPLLSPDYISDDFLNSPEVSQAITERENDLYVFPIIIRPCRWNQLKWMHNWKSYPSSGDPLDKLTQEAKKEVIKNLQVGITRILEHKAKKIAKEVEDQIPKSSKKPRVFISYSHQDGDFADLLKLHLERNEIDTWTDIDSLDIGEDWKDGIDFSINESIAVIVIVSPDSKLSEYVIYEWSYAMGKEKPIFPILLRECKLHPKLSDLQVKDFSKRGLRPWNQLVASIKKIEINEIS